MVYQQTYVKDRMSVSCNIYDSFYCFQMIYLEKIASQSHSYPVLGSLYSANNAADRNTTTCSRTPDIGYASRFKNVLWKVDLGRVHNLYNMGILFKSYDGYGMYTYNPNNRKNTILVLPI